MDFTLTERLYITEGVLASNIASYSFLTTLL